MLRSRSVQLGLVLLLVAAGCSDAGLPTEPVGDPLLAVFDGSHDGIAGFHFLPPMVKNPGYGGSFDAAVSPVVEVCATTACAAFHATFSMTEGSGSEVVRRDAADEHYIVNWHARETGAVAGQTYRVRVRVNDVVLGYADVTVVSTGREAIEVRSDGSIALVANQTLPVKFRIETGIVGAVVVTPAEATIDVGATQQFSAAFQDLHGEPLVGPAVTWSSNVGDVATVDAGGLATGVTDGSTTITASAGPASGTAALTVTGASVAKSWHVIPGPFESSVLALATYGDDLIAGGFFTTFPRIARWDGVTWHRMPGMNGGVHALQNFGGDLIAGGDFTSAGGNSVLRVARWNGSVWQSMGGMNSTVRDFTVFDGELIAGGSFTSASGQTANRVARWTGSGWQPMGTGMDAPVFTLAVHDGDLIAGGGFSSASGQTANRVARWDGSAWQPMGTGMPGNVSALVVHNGDLIAGGSVSTASGLEGVVARWDGSQWQSMGTGMNFRVSALAVFEGDLITGGSFTIASGVTARRTARWDGSAWQPMANTMNNGGVNTFAIYDGDLIAGGRFSIQVEPGAMFSWDILGRWGTP